MACCPQEGDNRFRPEDVQFCNARYTNPTKWVSDYVAF